LNLLGSRLSLNQIVQIAKMSPMSSAVHFFKQGTTFQLPHPRRTSNWIKKVIESEHADLMELNYIFCSDRYLLGINRQFLNHDTYTDIITFGMGDGVHIEGEIYISIPRVRENAKAQGVSFHDELDRVIIHGVLHLLGYSDKTPRKKALMRKKEDACLSLR
jgi:rRNA maturation RNase YbeY